MVALISVGVSERVEELRERLVRELDCLRAEGLELQWRTLVRGSLTFVACDPVRKPLTPDADRRLRLLVANAVADLIVNRWESALLRRVIRLNYGYFSPEEQEEIHLRAVRRLRAEAGGTGVLLERLRRKGRILARLSEYLERHGELVVDGFLTFRLRDYLAELEQAVDLAVEEYGLEREQEEFLDLLRSYVAGQEPRLARADLVFARGRFRVLDEAGRVAAGPELQALGLEAAAGPAEDEEQVLSALLALVPEAVLVHGAAGGPAGLVETVRRVFGERVTLCPGCRLCGADA